jgi:hypothetical protein
MRKRARTDLRVAISSGRPYRDHNFWFARRYFGYDLEMTPRTRTGQRPLERGITMKAAVLRSGESQYGTRKPKHRTVQAGGS